MMLPATIDFKNSTIEDNQSKQSLEQRISSLEYPKFNDIINNNNQSSEEYKTD